MPYGITQYYLPPGRGDIPAVTPAEAGTRLSDPRCCPFVSHLDLFEYIDRRARPIMSSWKRPFSRGIWAPQLVVHWAATSLHPRRHIDRFSRFARLTVENNTQADRHAITPVALSRIYDCYTYACYAA